MVKMLSGNIKIYFSPGFSCMHRRMCIRRYTPSAPKKLFKGNIKNSVELHVEMQIYLSSKKIFLKEKSLQTMIFTVASFP